jgi:hypothetical protein
MESDHNADALAYGLAQETSTASAAGECHCEAEVEDPVEELTDAQLIQTILDLEEDARPLNQAIKQAREQLQFRMVQRQASLIDTADHKVELVETKAWEYDIPQLLKLQDVVTGDQFKTALTQEWRVNKTGLNKLVKLGESVQRIVNTGCRQIIKSRTIKISSKTALDGGEYGSATD